MSEHGLLMTTLPSRDAAAAIANLLIDEKLAACVQLMPVESFYLWEGKTQNEAEVLLLIKTHTALFDSAIARIKTAHPYSVPEIVGMPFTTGLKSYFDWIDASTAQ
jgi:periplasmic divalent cation tolerance protein